MNISEVRTMLQEGLIGARLVGKLAPYLKKSVNIDEAKALLSIRLEQRDSDFVQLVKTLIYDLPKNPYLKLLKNAGCEYQDFQNLITKEGVEGALHRLFLQGVYLTSQEFQGGAEIVRGSLRFHAEPKQLHNPYAKRHIPIRSSGSRSHGTQVVRDLEYVFDNTLVLAAWLEARNILDAEIASWSVPGGVVLSTLIKFTNVSPHPIRWFSQLDTSEKGLNFRYRWSARLLELSGRLAGVPFPRAKHVSLEDPLPIIHWMQECLQKGRTPHLFTFASSAVRLAQCALEHNISLKGTYITMSGEPITSSRLATVKKSHADALPSMGCVELGHVGYGCLNPETADDMHLLKDLLVAIQPGQHSDSIPLHPHTLLFSTLRKATPLILLNFSNGDQAVLKRRACGCPLGQLGFDTHYSHIRNSEKLTSGGMAFLDTDIVKILEQELPKKFGGGPTDYQLREDETPDGRPQLYLVVHPRLGTVDEVALKSIFLEKIGSGSGAEKLTSRIWRDSDMLQIERHTPRISSTGKIQHMHIQKKQADTHPK
jgi:hypothetical protein